MAVENLLPFCDYCEWLPQPVLRGDLRLPSHLGCSLCRGKRKVGGLFFEPFIVEFLLMSFRAIDEVNSKRVCSIAMRDDKTISIIRRVIDESAIFQAHPIIGCWRRIIGGLRFPPRQEDYCDEQHEHHQGWKNGQEAANHVGAWR